MKMNEKYRYLGKNTILFTISSFSSKLLVFLLVPLYTSVLTTAEYGIADLITTTSTLLIYIFTLNITDSVLRFAIDQDTDREKYLSFGLKILIEGSALLGISIFIAYRLQVFSWNNYCYLFLWLHFFFNALYQILNNYLRAIDKVKEVAISGIISTIVTIIFNIVLLLIVRISLLGYLISMVAGVVASTIYCIFSIRIPFNKIFNSKCENSDKKAMLQYSVPLIFNGVAWWINNSIDKYFVVAICGAALNGIYSVSYKIPTILTVFHSIFSQAWNLSAIKEFDKNDEDHFFANTYSTYNAFLVLVCSALILFNKFIAHFLFAKDFYIAWESSSILLVSVVFSALSGVLGSIFTAVKDSRIFAVSTVISAIINCILNAILIPLYGINGAAIATAISFASIWAIRLLCSKKYINWKLKLRTHILSYILLVIQVILEHGDGFIYWMQIIIVLLLLFVYKNEMKTIAGKLILSVRSRRTK